MNRELKALIYSFFFGVFMSDVKAETLTIKTTNETFNDGLFFKKRYICEDKGGENISPHLIISNIPKNTKSLLLIIEDPDAKPVVGKTFIHMIALLDKNSRDLPEGSFNENNINKNVKKLFKSDSKQKEYYGPCPPKGHVHVYIFTLLALNKDFDIGDNSSPDYFRDTWSKKSKFYNEWKNNIIGEPAMLKGKYQEK